MTVKSEETHVFRILLVNDNAEVSNSAGLILTKAGHDLSRVADGFHALNRLENEHFSMVILGPHIKNMTNMELVSLIRANKELDLGSLPIIQIFPLEEEAENVFSYEECLEVGVNEVIKKYNAKNLAESVKFYYDIEKEKETKDF